MTDQIPQAVFGGNRSGMTSTSPPTAFIEIQNARSRIQTTPEVLARLKRLVAYREAELPPTQVQRMIKAFLARPADQAAALRQQAGGSYRRAPRLGYDIDIGLFYHWYGPQLAELGWPQSRLGPKLWDGVLRRRGIWDGWTSLISASGEFGTGLLPHVERALRLRLGVQATYTDLRASPASQRPYTAIKAPSLYAFQEEAVEAWLAAGGRGVIDLPPRSGKTHIAIEATRRVGLPTLIIVPRKVLVTQTVARFEEWFPKGSVVGVTGGRPSVRKQRELNRALVWIATPQTAAGRKDDTGERTGMQGIETRQLLIIDEFHHAAAATYRSISRAARSAYYRLGLTGTHFRADGRDMLMHSVLSRAVYSRSITEMVNLGRLVPARVAMVQVPGYAHAGSGERMYTVAVTHCAERNAIVVQAVRQLVAAGKRVLVLVKEVAHARTLADLLPEATQVDGSDSKQVRPALDALEARQVPVVIGTSVIGEGVDVPAADALVYAAGGKSKVKVVQDFFRVLTASEGKACGLVVDFADNHNDRLVQSAARRLGLYRQCFPTDVITSLELGAWINR